MLENIRAEHGGIKIRLEEQTNVMRELDREIAETEKSITIRDVQQQNLLQERQRGEMEFTTRHQEHGEFQKQLQSLREEEQLKKQVVLELTAAGDTLQTQINAVEEDLEGAREELRSIHRNLDARQNEFNLTKSFIDNMEGFPESIKFLNSIRNGLHAPLLSDIISCPAEFRVAIENFLDQYLNFYVVADMNDAMNAVNLLSASAKGRANFLY